MTRFLASIILMLALANCSSEKQDERTLEEARKDALVISRILAETVYINSQGNCDKNIRILFDEIISLERIGILRFYRNDGVITISTIKEEEGTMMDAVYYMYISGNPDNIDKMPKPNKEIYVQVVPIRKLPKCIECHQENKDIIGLLELTLAMKRQG